METNDVILFLGSDNSPLLDWLIAQGEKVIQTHEKISPSFIEENNIGFLISYGYRHILGKSVLEKLQQRAINLHISLLPWNRGADPNFWSFIEDTPKGVTIHYIDEGVDTGDIIIQKEINFDSDTETFATTYEKLQTEVQNLFKFNWKAIRNGNIPSQSQIGKGSTHKSKDKESLLHLLPNGWNTCISYLEEYIAETQMSRHHWKAYYEEIDEIRKNRN